MNFSCKVYIELSQKNWLKSDLLKTNRDSFVQYTFKKTKNHYKYFPLSVQKKLTNKQAMKYSPQGHILWKDNLFNGKYGFKSEYRNAKKRWRKFWTMVKNSLSITTNEEAISKKTLHFPLHKWYTS